MKMTELMLKAKSKIRPPGKKTIVLLAVNAGLLVLMGVFMGLFSWAKNSPDDQKAAQYWANGAQERYAQISLFVADSDALSLDRVMEIRQAMEKKLVENSIEPANKDARAWIDAYSMTGKTTASKGNVSAEVLATGVGGDFFFFHQYTLEYGQFIHEKDLLKDIVVIDIELAWRLYGAANVIGFELDVGGQRCFVGGVIRRNDTWPESKTYGETSRIFVSQHLMEKIRPDAGITCYEMVLPDPVTGFALQMAKDVIGADETYCEYVENSARFGLSSMLASLRDFTSLPMQTKAIAFPYWENAARAAQSLSVLFLGAALLMLVFPAVCVIIMIIKLLGKRKKAYRRIIDYFRKKQLEKWQKKQSEKTEKEEVHV